MTDRNMTDTATVLAVRYEKEGPVVRRQGGVTTAVKLAACTPLECVVESGLAEGDRFADF